MLLTFCSLRLPTNTYAWIGLTTTADLKDCGVSESDCTRVGWEWADGTPYTYPGGYHDWKNDTPDRYDRCVIIAFHGWSAVTCPDDTETLIFTYPYICEKGNCMNAFDPEPVHVTFEYKHLITDLERMHIETLIDQDNIMAKDILRDAIYASH